MESLDQILDVARHQHGVVASHQVDVSRKMFSHLESTDRLERVERGIYRVPSFPTSETEPLVVAYLWSRERGVICHESALACHQLSDVMPNAVHICMPPGEPLPRNRPSNVTVHYGVIGTDDRQWYDVVPVTTVGRTLIDLALEGFDLGLFEQALNEALDRGLVPPDYERSIIRHLVVRSAELG